MKVIITGATGMVGEGVLHECLLHPAVTKVLIINRKPSGISHPKMQEIVHPDFFNLAPIAPQLSGYDACFFCLGVSSLGMKEPEYRRITYDLTMHFAETLVQQSPHLVFTYVSGAGTDRSLMWAKVKRQTENDLAKLPFKNTYAFRPGFMKPTPGLKNTIGLYTFINWLYPAMRKFFPDSVSTLAELGQAMINSVLKGYPARVLEVRDIVKLAHA
ncbi:MULTISPECIES: epimerase [unclassified Siphonobacter]|uniref:epimerase n=1 Tax=unclassified Siphonobacter TaxID=2635712 RepID=UPI0027808591|nr:MULTISPECIES: epimerase [unclassified Siphonobacter]MDQ1088460.1 uncharacterized protein YbjT (DUF2867 family) [Siphonobacter sp. SORGH_AS_1065]MDR6194603.1 uncharacterized protein YbjT (DUF2867 family) [Siphonobacter sp. SORGH_AS_0500]